jgi:hypothetical protein
VTRVIENGEVNEKILIYKVECLVRNAKLVFEFGVKIIGYCNILNVWF